MKKRTFEAIKLRSGLKWENIEFEEQEKNIKVTMMKKLLNDKLIYNEILIDKRMFMDFAKEIEDE